MKFYLGLTLIIAIVTAGVSPACAFMAGGKTMIELCSANGDIRTVEVPAAMDPFAEQIPQQNERIAIDNLDDCAFCFAQVLAKAIQNSNMDLAVFVSPAYLSAGAGTFIPVSLDMGPFYARAPPVFS